MALQNVTSEDARKPQAVAWLKAVSGARSVTMVKYDTVRGVFVGHCLNRLSRRDGGSKSLGFWAVGLDGSERGHYASMEDYKVKLRAYAPI